MRIKKISSFFLVLMLFPMVFLSCETAEKANDFDKIVKISLREVGNRLLLANQDSTSLILPIKKVKANQYQLEFQNQLSITPDSLVKTVNTSLKKAKLPKRYIVEVFQCQGTEVFYSFKINRQSNEDIVPCLGRNLPSDCYTIYITFQESQTVYNPQKMGFWALTIGILSAIIFLVLNKKYPNKNKTDYHFVKMGNYKFYHEQNVLIKDAVEIKLSVKECELMQMFSKHQNQIIKRETLIKSIWEDNGVFVGRSLDTFISKLRKKLKDDDSINIVNVHGVGYRLEVKN